MRMTLRSSWALAPIGTLAALVLLLGTVSLGLRLRASGDPDALPDAAALDYGPGGFGAFSPLSASFIRDVLGGVIDLPSDSGGSAPSDSTREVVPTAATKPFTRVEVTHAFTNDDRADALRIPSVPFTAHTDTRQATRERGETSACGPVGGSVWYRFKAPIDTGLIANTFGSNYSTTLGVFALGDGQSMIGCDTDVQGNSIVQFLADEGTTYLFQISGAARGGDLVFNLDPEGVTTIESLSSNGAEGNLGSFRPSLSADGRFVAFESDSTNLVPGDDNNVTDIFVRDRARSTTTRVSVSSSGAGGNSASTMAFISGNGRYVAFNSLASNLVANDTNGITDVFVHDLRTKRTERVSVSSSEKEAAVLVPAAEDQCAPGDLPVYCLEKLYPSISHDGRFVAFQSTSPNLVRNDRNNAWDAFVRDRSKGTTERVSVSSTGEEHSPAGAEGEEWAMPSISGNGRFVSFRTSADHLTPGDDNHAFDMFVHDRATRTTERIAGSAHAVVEFRTPRALSFDGRHVTFATTHRPGRQGPAPTNSFVHDRKTGKMTRVNVSSTGKTDPQMTSARSVSISANGRYVTFHAGEAKDVNYDSGDVGDVFIRDLRTHTTVQLTRFPGDVAGRASCRPCGASIPDVSADGRVVAYQSDLVTPLLSATSFTQIYVNERPAPAG